MRLAMLGVPGERCIAEQRPRHRRAHQQRIAGRSGCLPLAVLLHLPMQHMRQTKKIKKRKESTALLLTDAVRTRCMRLCTHA